MNDGAVDILNRVGLERSNGGAVVGRHLRTPDSIFVNACECAVKRIFIMAACVIAVMNTYAISVIYLCNISHTPMQYP